jgi:hypothetical protein
MFGQHKTIRAQLRHSAEPPTAQQQTSRCSLGNPPGERAGKREGSSGAMDAMRKAGEALESATGLPHHPHGRGAPAHGAGGAAASTASGPPEWATSDHYPGEGARPAARYYLDDAAETTKVRKSVGGCQHSSWHTTAFGFAAPPAAQAALARLAPQHSTLRPPAGQRPRPR